ncbi:hypothetical protein RJ640_020255 [Escallonia rubra]|uniref:EF-hand domain-containing protein n=1 Tax=Escallonia rubra TaxID=112253 RepID=A0AA88S0S8_9ASTE|nr:hypothetical protein RJ640_020255 [Escallonia rubra]
MVENYEGNGNNPSSNGRKAPMLGHHEGSKGAKIRLTEEQLRLWFIKYDTNRDGNLTRAELTEAFSRLGSFWGGYRAMQALLHADANDDGCIDEDEMEELVRYANKRKYALA